MQRASLSIVSNIAEGKYSRTKGSYLNFLRIAFGSGAELETQIIVARKVLDLPAERYQRSEGLLIEVMKMLNTLTYKLTPTANPY